MEYVQLEGSFKCESMAFTRTRCWVYCRRREGLSTHEFVCNRRYHALRTRGRVKNPVEGISDCSFRVSIRTRVQNKSQTEWYDFRVFQYTLCEHIEYKPFNG